MHVPVLLQEMLTHLRPRPDGIYLDGTLGAGGHSEAILQASEPEGQVVALDLDPLAVEAASSRLRSFGKRAILVHGGYHNAPEILGELGIGRIDGAILDLGLSSDQLEERDRGFSFQFNGRLDMRFDTTSGQTVAELLDSVSKEQLVEILWKFGDERHSRKIATAIIQARHRHELNTSSDLARIVMKVYGPKRHRIHPATRTFQALRIAVNRELENLQKGLNEIPELLNPGCRLCTISYHSLEDRMVSTHSGKKVLRRQNGTSLLENQSDQKTMRYNEIPEQDLQSCECWKH